jgi:hypothetical protein
VIQNYTNTGTTSDFAVQYERDLRSNDRLGLILRREQSEFDVPNEQIQESNGQLQSRNSSETMGIVSYQHVFSPSALGDFRGMVRDDSDGFWSNALSIPIIAAQQRGFREGHFLSQGRYLRRRSEGRTSALARAFRVRELFLHGGLRASSGHRRAFPRQRCHGIAPPRSFNMRLEAAF